MQNNRKRTGPGGKGSFSRSKFKGKGDKGGFRKEGERSHDKKSYTSDRKGKFEGDSERSYGKKSFGDRKEKYKKEWDDNRSSDKDKKYEKDSDRSYGKKSFGDRKKYGENSERSYEKKSFGDRKDKYKNDRDDKRPFDKDKKYGKDSDRSYGKKSFGDRKKYGENSERSYEKKSFGDRKDKYNKDSDHRDRKSFDRKEKGEFKKDSHAKDEKKSYGTERTRRYKEKKYGRSDESSEKAFFKKDGDDFKRRKEGDSEHGRTDDRRDFKEDKYSGEAKRKPFKKGNRAEKEDYEKSYYNKDLKYTKGHEDRPSSRKKTHKESLNDSGLIRLNKYISNAGICSRREADELIKAGAVSVNGKVVTEMGFKVSPDDKIAYGGETLRNEKKIYLLLNKPKDYITTMDDPRERRTVMELIKGACRERIYPVGRLDRNTTGLLLFTNDGELATRLMHPKFGIRKIYHVTIGRNMKPEDYAKLLEGFELEDGFIKPDEVSFVGDGRKEIGIEIHSGKNRIVRRIFEHLGYEILKLDRVAFAGLSKKDIPRGKWRFLTPKEVNFLKMVG